MIENITKTDKIYCEVETTRIDWSDEKRSALRKELSVKYGIPMYHVDVQPSFIEYDADGNRITMTDNIITDIRDAKFQQNLFNEWLELKGIKDVDMNDILDIDAMINAKVDYNVYSKYKRYKFKHLRWSNYCSYGPDNFFDFTKLKGLVRLNSIPENQGGKTTFAIDLLRFTLFGQSKKSPNLADVFNDFNPSATEVMCEACIEIDGEDYIIRRTVKRPALNRRTAKSKCTQTIEYFKYLNGTYEEIENKVGESNNETKQFIIDAIGKPEDYDLVISATTRTLGDILELGQADKTRLFSKWMGLSMIEEKESIAKKLYKERIEPTLKSKMFDKVTLADEIESYQTINNDCNDIIESSEKQLGEANSRIEQLKEDEKQLFAKKKEVKEELSKIDVATVTAKINRLADEYRIKAAQKADNEKYIEDNKNVEYDEGLRNAKQTEINNLDVEMGILRGEVKSLKSEIENINTLISQGVCPTCKHPIDIAEQNGFIDEKNTLVEQKIAEGVKKKTEKDTLSVEVLKMMNDKSIVDERVRRSIKNEALSAEIENITIQGKECRRQLKEIEQNAENLRVNNEIDADIRTVEVAINTENGIKDRLIGDINRAKSTIDNNNKEIARRNELIEVLTKEEQIKRNWEIYKELVSKDGIVKLILKRALPILNAEVNRYLCGLCDFKNEISVDENGSVLMKLVFDDHKLDLGNASSGFESVMSALAIRTALASVSSLPLPSFVCFDEILDGVAVSNYDNVKELYERIAKNYDFILHISHNEAIADWHNQCITIVKDEERISKVEFNL